MSARNQAPPAQGGCWLPQPDILEPALARGLPRVPHPALQQGMGEAHHSLSDLRQFPPHPVIIEEQLAAQYNYIEALRVEKQRLVATNESLKHEIEGTRQQHAENDLLMRGKLVRMENELSASWFELLEVHTHLKDLTAQINVMTNGSGRVTSTSTNNVEVEGLKTELERARANVEHERKRYAECFQHEKDMEDKLVTMAQEKEKLLAELAKAINRADNSVAGSAGNLSGVSLSNSKKKRRKKSKKAKIMDKSLSNDASSKKKLLVLAVNVLASIERLYPTSSGGQYEQKIAKRPFCDDFLKFCFENFDVGVWSSRTKEDLDGVIDELFGDLKDRLLFCWDLSHCSQRICTTLENSKELLVFKDLRRIWENDDPNLPWKKGDYGKSDTILLDDSPYKSFLNPSHTAIFPKPYNRGNETENSLGLGGDIRTYLEGLLSSENVQEYVKQHPFGQDPINENDQFWGYLNSKTKSESPRKMKKRLERWKRKKLIN